MKPSNLSFFSNLKVNTKKFVLHHALKGDTVECPCCGSTYETFLPAGIYIKRANAKCIKCDSLERHRNLWLFFSRNKKIFGTHTKLLHVAPEKTFYKYFTSRNDIEYYPIDLEPWLYDTKKMDITDLRFDNDYFDAVICSHVLEHVLEDVKAMREIHRVLKPGGWGVLNVPFKEAMETTREDATIDTPQKRAQNFGQSDHVRVYGRDYVNRLKMQGFNVQVIQYALEFTEQQMFRYGLKKNELIFLCYK